MAGLGLRYCPQHPSEPLMLVSKTNGTYWRCESPDGCAHTENAMRGASGPVAINGRDVRVARPSRATKRL